MKKTFKKTLKIGGNITLGAFGTIIAALVVTLIVGMLVSITWNYTMPHIFGLPTLNFLQGFALLFLGRLMVHKTKKE